MAFWEELRNTPSLPLPQLSGGSPLGSQYFLPTQEEESWERQQEGELACWLDRTFYFSSREQEEASVLGSRTPP